MSNWFDVENMEKRQVQELQNSEMNEANNKSDFVSYKMLYEGYSDEESGIKSHNLDSDYAPYIAKVLDRSIRKYAKKTIFIMTRTTCLSEISGEGLVF